MKKAQAAMEFLMTYGWAILVVLAAIGALAYFGVLSPDSFLQSKCVISGGFSCTEYKINSDGTLQMKVANNLGVDANVTLINVTGCTTQPALGMINKGADTGLLSYTCALAIGKLKADIAITYVKSGESVSHTATGSVSGKGE